MRVDKPPLHHPDAPWFNSFASKRCIAGGWHKKETVYCVTECAGGPIKIGVASNLSSRISTFQSATWRPILLCWTATGYLVHEGAIKHALKQFKIRGEWFTDDTDIFKTALPMGASENDLILMIERWADMYVPKPIAKAKPLPRPLFTFKADE